MIKYVILETEDSKKIYLRNISPESSFKGTPISYEEADGNNIFFGDSSLLKITSFDWSYFSTLSSWMRTKTKVKVSIVGIKKSLVWADFIPFIIGFKMRNKSGTKNSFFLTFQMKEGNHNITIGSTNILFPNVDQEAENAGN